MKNLLKLLKISVLKGRVTIKYPRQRAIVPEGLRGRPEINFDTCIGCGACVKVCPPNALTMEDRDHVRTIKMFYGLCIMCGMCDEVCPVDAIRVLPEFELASLTKEDLEQVFQYLLVKCKICGTYYTTKRAEEDVLRAYSETIAGYKEELQELVYLCPDCRRNKLSEQFASLKEER